MQAKFKSDDGSDFKMFDSKKSTYGTGQKDLMFKDATINLYNTDSSTYQEYLGQDYVNTVEGKKSKSRKLLNYVLIPSQDSSWILPPKSFFSFYALKTLQSSTDFVWPKLFAQQGVLLLSEFHKHSVLSGSETEVIN